MTIYPLGDGYTCWNCGQWVPNGCTHSCPTGIWPTQWTVNPVITTTFTTDASALLLRISRDGEHYMVTDLIGTRYGHAQTLAEALAAWEDQVQDLLGLNEDDLGDPILSETRAYKKALGV